MNLKATLESLLFVSIRPLTAKALAERCGADAKKVQATLDELMADYASSDRGVRLQKNGSAYQLVTSPDASGVVAGFLKEETTGELTHPQLETLTVIAYRGPVTKTELELVRGVNCSLILRNLQMRGLIEEREDPVLLVPVYTVSFAFMRFLGISQTKELPDFERLNADPNLAHLLGKTAPKPGGGDEGSEADDEETDEEDDQ